MVTGLLLMLPIYFLPLVEAGHEHQGGESGGKNLVVPCGVPLPFLTNPASLNPLQPAIPLPHYGPPDRPIAPST
jgi:hypothetical protein